jgi:hypothetical protein
MAVVRLTRVESEIGNLPNVCMRCGAPATTVTEKYLAWQPRWIAIILLVGLLFWKPPQMLPVIFGGLLYFIIGMILKKRMKLLAPMCEQHRSHWFRQVIFNFIALAAFPLMIVVGVFALPLPESPMGEEEQAFGRMVCFLTVVLLLAWVIVNVVVSRFLIHPTVITDRDMELSGVHDSFVEALTRWRARETPERGA